MFKPSNILPTNPRTVLSKLRMWGTAALASLCLLAVANQVSAQANSYTFAASTNNTLLPLTTPTTAIGASVDDAMTAAAQNIGFTFNFAGVPYTTFWPTPDGFFRLGGTTSTSQFSNSLNSTTNIPKLAAIWDDLATGLGGSVRYETQGTAPNRRLVVEWFVTMPRATGGNANSTFQIVIYETTNVIEYRYGTLNAGGNASYSLGIVNGANDYINVNASATPTTSITTPNNSQTFLIPSGTMYTFTAPSCFNPSILSNGYTSYLNYRIINSNTGAALGYQYRITTGATPGGTPTLNASTTYDAALTGGTQYTYQVRSICAVGDTSAWTTLTFTTPASCSAPANGTRSYTSYQNYTFNWTPPTILPANGFKFEYNIGNTLSPTPSTTYLPNTATNITLPLTGATSYSFRITSLCSATDSASNATVSFLTPSTCASPTNGTRSYTSYGNYTFNWTAPNPAPADGYRFEYNVGATLSLTPSVTYLAAGVTSVTLPLTGATSYSFRIFARCSATDSGANATVSFLTPATCVTPGVSSVSPGGAAATFNMTVPTFFPAQYRVFIRPGSQPTYTQSYVVTGATPFTITGLAPSTSYRYQVRAICTATDSTALTTEATFTTQALPPAFSAARNTGVAYGSIFPGGTTFTWNSTGTDDNYSTGGTNIGFTFNYLGVNYTQFQVSTNGYITMGTGQTPSTFSNLASLSTPRRIIAPFWEDLVTNGNPGTTASLNASIRYTTSGAPGSQVLTVEWKEMETFSNAGPALNFQLKLHEGTNEIEFAYGTMKGFSGSANYAFSYTTGVNADLASNNVYYVQQQENTNAFSDLGGATGNAGTNNLRALPVCNSSIILTPQVAATLTNAPGFPVPSNDEQVNAQPLPIASAPASVFCFPYTNRGATASASIPVCNAATPGTPDDDVWFTFSIPTSLDMSIDVLSSGGHDAVVQLFDNSLNSLRCKNSAGAGLRDSIQFNSMPAGTYFVRVYHATASYSSNPGLGGNTSTLASGEFFIDVYGTPTPPANNNIAGAIALTPAQNCNGIAGTTVAATASPQANPCTGNPDDDVWYSFVAGVPTDTVIVDGAVGFNPAFAVYDNANVQVGSCVDATGLSATETGVFTGLTPGATYFVRVFHSPAGSGTGAFTICVKEDVPCTNPPTAGTANGPTVGCVGANLLYTITGQSSFTLIQWQESFDNGVTFTDVTAGTSSILTYLYGGPVQLRARIRCSANPSFESFSNVITVSTNFFYNCYCASNSTSNFYEDIQQVTIGTAPANPAVPEVCGSANNVGYTSYTSVAAATVSQGNLTPIVINTNEYLPLSGDGWIKIYLDANQDGSFVASEEVASTFVSTISCQAVNLTLNIPFTALLGTTGLRIVYVGQNGGVGTNVNPCGTYLYGETEDYRVNVVAPPPGDYAVQAVLSPATGPNLPNGIAVTAVFQNASAINVIAGTVLPIDYTYYNNIFTENYTLTDDMAPGELDTFTFATTINPPPAGLSANIRVRVQVPGDPQSANNKLVKAFTNQSTNNLPFATSFEANEGWSVSNSGAGWSRGTPAKVIGGNNRNSLSSAFNGSNAWVLGGLSGINANSENSSLISPLFNFTGATAPYLSFFYWADAESSFDGVRVQYSLNGGTTWVTINDAIVADWYNDNSLSNAGGFVNGFSGQTGNESWRLAQSALPAAVIGQSAVQFRFQFAADGSVNYGGFAIDQLTIADQTPLASAGLRSVDCGFLGFSKTGARSTIGANAVPTAQGYLYSVTAAGVTQQIFGGQFLSLNTAQFAYNTTYSVTARSIRNGIYSAAGTSCQVRLVQNPTVNVPATQVRSSDCGFFGYTLNTGRNYVGADAVAGVDEYIFEFTRTSDNTLFTSAGNSNRFINFPDINVAQPGFILYGETYSVRVRANVDGTLGAYGASCNIGLVGQPVATPTSLRPFDCGSTRDLDTGYIIANVVPAATGYTFNFFASSGAVVPVATSANTGAVLALDTLITPALIYGTTYYVTVDVDQDGITALGTDTCQVIIAPIAPRLVGNANEVSLVTLYPNPANAAGATIEGNDIVAVELTDLAGRTIEARRNVSGTRTAIGAGLRAGAYNVRITLASGELRNLRLVIAE